MPSQNGFAIGRQPASPSLVQTSATHKVKGKCFYCDKVGYWKRDCFKRKADEANRNTQ